MIQIPQIFQDIIDKGCDVACNESDDIPSTFKPEYITSFKYPLKDGTLTGHCDKKKSWILLISLVQSCGFYIKGPDMAKRKYFEFKSRDCLIFDASSKANIFHGILIVYSVLTRIDTQ